MWITPVDISACGYVDMWISRGANGVPVDNIVVGIVRQFRRF